MSCSVSSSVRLNRRHPLRFALTHPLPLFRFSRERGLSSHSTNILHHFLIPSEVELRCSQRIMAPLLQPLSNNETFLGLVSQLLCGVALRQEALCSVSQYGAERPSPVRNVLRMVQPDGRRATASVSHPTCRQPKVGTDCFTPPSHKELSRKNPSSSSPVEKRTLSPSG